uniref:Uncharacterized protein n=1 Tax=Anguilla anguilla TaxID=7936 RepID=A0A0E9Q5D1_ANGAN
MMWHQSPAEVLNLILAVLMLTMATSHKD